MQSFLIDFLVEQIKDELLKKFEFDYRYSTLIRALWQTRTMRILTQGKKSKNRIKLSTKNRKFLIESFSRESKSVDMIKYDLDNRKKMSKLIPVPRKF